MDSTVEVTIWSSMAGLTSGYISVSTPADTTAEQLLQLFCQCKDVEFNKRWQLKKGEKVLQPLETLEQAGVEYGDKLMLMSASDSTGMFTFGNWSGLAIFCFTIGLLGLIILLLTVTLEQEMLDDTVPVNKYAVFIDADSSDSSFFLFHWDSSSVSSNGMHLALQCHQQGPISGFLGSNSSVVLEYLHTCLSVMEAGVPQAERHNSTMYFVVRDQHMRLTRKWDSAGVTALLETVFYVLHRHSSFTTLPEDVVLLSPEQEGQLSWMTNYSSSTCLDTLLRVGSASLLLTTALLARTEPLYRLHSQEFECISLLETQKRHQYLLVLDALGEVAYRPQYSRGFLSYYNRGTTQRHVDNIGDKGNSTENFVNDIKYDSSKSSLLTELLRDAIVAVEDPCQPLGRTLTVNVTELLTPCTLRGTSHDGNKHRMDKKSKYITNNKYKLKQSNRNHEELSSDLSSLSAMHDTLTGIEEQIRSLLFNYTTVVSNAGISVASPLLDALTNTYNQQTSTLLNQMTKEKHKNDGTVPESSPTHQINPRLTVTVTGTGDGERCLQLQTKLLLDRQLCGDTFRYGDCWDAGLRRTAATKQSVTLVLSGVAHPLTSVKRLPRNTTKFTNTTNIITNTSLIQEVVTTTTTTTTSSDDFDPHPSLPLSPRHWRESLVLLCGLSVADLQQLLPDVASDNPCADNAYLYALVVVGLGYDEHSWHKLQWRILEASDHNLALEFLLQKLRQERDKEGDNSNGIGTEKDLKTAQHRGRYGKGYSRSTTSNSVNPTLDEAVNVQNDSDVNRDGNHPLDSMTRVTHTTAGTTACSITAADASVPSHGEDSYLIIEPALMALLLLFLSFLLLGAALCYHYSRVAGGGGAEYYRVLAKRTDRVLQM